MGAKPNMSGTEKISGYIVLFLLILIGAGVIAKQFSYRAGRFGFNPTIEEDASDEVEPVFSGITPDDFKPMGPTREYNAENLYEKINGKAPLYKERGFESLLTQRFVHRNNSEQIMELYLFDMGNMRNSFSVYSTQKRADTQNIEKIDHGYGTDNGVYFVHGEYYIELVGYTEDKELLDAVNVAAVNLTQEIEIGARSKIAELELFPEQHLVSGSIKLYPNGAYGFDGFKDLFSGRFTIDGQEMFGFIAQTESDQKASRMAQSYHDFVTDNSGTVKKAENQLLKGKVLDFYDTTEIVFSAGRFVGGVHEAMDQQAGEKLGVEIYKALQSIKD